MMTSLEQWLRGPCGLLPDRLEPLAFDASFRRYTRIHQGNRTFIAMDASAEKDSCVPFAAIANALRKQGLQAPDIFARDFDRGFLLLEDLGDRLFLRELNDENACQYYRNALDALCLLQETCVTDWTLKLFTAALMLQELNLFREWFLEKHLNLILTRSTQTMLESVFMKLAERAASQPVCFMHRDYHSANLMVLPDDQVGILDFQDAFMGPVTYDAVSLLRDCYISWPEKMVYALLAEFREKIRGLQVSADEFTCWFDWMGLQRHMKALLTFSRKYHRDHNANYLQHIPRTLNYILSVSERYEEMQPLHQFLMQEVLDQCAE